jgi:large subunit ribosomal protein L28
MAKICQYSGKRALTGHQIVRRGKAKKQGGVGKKITGKTKRRWLPNLQTIRVRDENGRVHRIKVCARYIKAGKFNKAPRNCKTASTT